MNSGRVHNFNRPFDISEMSFLSGSFQETICYFILMMKYIFYEIARKRKNTVLPRLFFRTRNYLWNQICYLNVMSFFNVTSFVDSINRKFFVWKGNNICIFIFLFWSISMFTKIMKILFEKIRIVSGGSNPQCTVQLLNGPTSTPPVFSRDQLLFQRHLAAQFSCSSLPHFVVSKSDILQLFPLNNV